MHENVIRRVHRDLRRSSGAISPVARLRPTAGVGPFPPVGPLLGDAHHAGVGVRAVCVAKSGWAMETEYVSFSPPRTTAVKMTRGPWFLDSFAGSWHFD